MLDLYDEFKAIIGALNQCKIDYAVCGGLAMAVYGLARATVDIDLLIAADDFEHVKAAVQPLGYTIEAMPMTFAKGAVEIRHLSKIDKETGIVLSLDLLLVTPQIEGAWKSRINVEWETEALPVASREGLMILESLGASDPHEADKQKVDMSPQAVTARLKLVSQLRRLCLSLATARPINPPAKPNEKAPAR